MAKGAGWSREGKSRAVTFDVYDKGLELWAARPSLSFEWFIFVNEAFLCTSTVGCKQLLE